MLLFYKKVIRRYFFDKNMKIHKYSLIVDTSAKMGRALLKSSKVEISLIHLTLD